MGYPGRNYFGLRLPLVLVKVLYTLLSSISQLGPGYKYEPNLKVKEILTIDNQIAIRRSIESMLRRQFVYCKFYGVSQSNALGFIKDKPGIKLIFYDPVLPNNRKAFENFIKIRALLPNSKILLHSYKPNTEFDLLAFLAAGASGFVYKDADKRQYLAAIATVMNGQTYIDQEIKPDLIGLLLRKHNANSMHSSFT
ncbi:helix-turn-helix domain-containing protein [Dyadobacter aurulentus]|uniref:response regulator transcription factor n=1 Tax=Dyadobacter sp. UC 10 TaxID=2605428 RepID=UPI0011F10DCB|nr:response regulator transcription factor [Dyadobacter sp. UC 10]KAA0993369.1 response regulator transcription factor [Dyadobacter sp. UC 10]